MLSLVPKGFIEDYLTRNREGAPLRQVTLRQVQPDDSAMQHDISGGRAEFIRSEALLRLDFGEGRKQGLLVLGAEDPHEFRANQGTDLLAFFAGVFERQMRRWLS